jgi:hypothetical protein
MVCSALPPDFVLRVRLDTHFTLAVCSGQSSDQRDFFVILKARKQGVDALRHCFARRAPVCFAAHGEVLHSAWGVPSALFIEAFVRAHRLMAG